MLFVPIFDHPANFRYPTYWHVRNYGLMTANPFALSYYYTTTNEVPVTTSMEISGDKGKLLYQNGLLKFYSFKSSIAELTFSSTDMWASPEVVEEKLELPQCETGHKEIMRNFCRSILFKEELIAPGEEGIWTVELFNALILSGKKNKSVDIPVDREEYEELLESFQDISYWLSRRKDRDNWRFFFRFRKT